MLKTAIIGIVNDQPRQKSKNIMAFRKTNVKLVKKTTLMIWATRKVMIFNDLY
jgi:hypothetical protein